MRVLFLDIDGVLNSRSWDRRRAQLNHGMLRPPDNFLPKEPQNLRRKAWDLDPEAMVTLKQIVTDYEFKVVISSGDRIGETVEYFEYLFGLCGCQFPDGTIIGLTPNLATDHRGDEIEAYLQGSDPCEYIIIDDRRDFHDYQYPHLLRTEMEYGIQEWDHEHVGMLLARNKGPA